MRYFPVEYVAVGSPTYLELHCFDGTYRGVKFHSEEDAQRACLPGRAELDCAAIADGLLPAGSLLVSRAGALEVAEDPAASALQGDDRRHLLDDPLDVVRLRFSISLMVERSEYIDQRRDASARARDPERAARYERGVAMLRGEK